MAFTASSIEMSFSLSRLRRTPRSMSIGPPRCPRAGGRPRPGGVLAAGIGRGPPELHLHPARPQLGVAELEVLAIDLQDDPVVTGRDDPALDGCGLRLGAGTGAAEAGQRYPYQPAHGAAPVTSLRERAVHARRGHLQR